MKNQKENFYQRTITFSINIIQLNDMVPSKRSTWVILDQLIRAATSIGANITEAKAASSKRDYINFYTHALKSANETIYWLTLLKEIIKEPINEIDILLDEAKQLGNIIAASVITMKKHRVL